MLQKFSGLLMATMLCAASASAQQSAKPFDPGLLKGPAKAPANEVMVLGTAHLSQLPASFNPAAIAVLNKRLIAWKPAIIAIEQRSGRQCYDMRQFPTLFADTVKGYCRRDPAAAGAATGLTVPAATAEMNSLLASLPAAPTAAQRRRLAAVMLAAGEPVSALVQWLRLPANERHAEAALDAGLVESLEKLRLERSEDNLIAAPVAAALGLERVFSMDDQTGQGPDMDEKAYGETITRAWNNPVNAERKKTFGLLTAAATNDDGVMALYRAMNEPEAAKVIYDSDFGAVLAEGSPAQLGRHYVTYWESRNLRMAANIREAVGYKMGSRTLVIVGASHKFYLEAYLNMMHDVRIVSTDTVLR